MATPQSFKEIINAALDSGIPEVAIRDHFGISAGTINRWASGRSSPHPVAMPIIVNGINKEWGRDYVLAQA